MAVIQCKMCGGTMDLPQGVTSGECPYCGTLTTFPKISNEHKEQLYSRAEHFRRQNDFDKAVSAYEALLNEDSSDPEAYWGLVLSRFGIEYVEDPVSHERIPTCHRVQFESILADADYRMALENSSGLDREIYEKEAQRIAEIQKGILAISSQEKPFDVFICYKETTEGGTRTRDSVVAQEIYYQLVNAGYKVFFARITLEDKLGQQYEPYIFAALNSAKVMLAIGSKKEYFEAVWVRNEWSRFLALMKKDHSKMLIPCYKDMDAYDIPQELSMLQSQDMSKIGFIQDLLRGIKKVVNPTVSAPTKAAPAAVTANNPVTPLLKRIGIFLTTKDWASASQYCERVLDINPENPQVYIYKIMAKNQLAAEEELYKIQNLESDVDFQLAMRFADEAGKQRLNGVLAQQAKIREEEERKQREEALRQAKIREEEERKQREEALRQQEAQRRQCIEEIRIAAWNLNFQDDPLTGIRELFSRFEENAGLTELTEIRQQFVRRVYDHAVNLEMADPDLAAELLRTIRELPEAAELRHGILSRNLRNKGNTSKDFLALGKQYRKQSEEENDPFLLKLADECGRIAEELNRGETYRKAVRLKKMFLYFAAASLFKKIPDHADSAEQAKFCLHRGWQMAAIIAAAILVVILAINHVTIGANLGIAYCQYRKAEKLAADRMPEAADWCRKAADQGYADAQLWLAKTYIADKQASDWAEKAWAQGKRLGTDQVLLLANSLLKRNPGKAVEWYKKAADTGNPTAFVSLAECYLSGTGVKKNPAEAVNWYRKAAEKGNAKAVAGLKRLADQGNTEAQNLLAECYYNGRGVAKDKTEAVKWFRKAAEQGLVQAQFVLGRCYVNGEGAAKDHAEAAKWFCKAAEQGNAKAASNLKQLAEQGNAEAQNLLAQWYYYGRVVSMDKTEAAKWYRKAAEQGHAKAQFVLGTCYANGEGTAKDHAEAVKWFRKAAGQGHAKAQYNLGVCYYDGQGITKDRTEAAKWYRKAAEQGHAKAQYNLGVCYEYGLGISMDDNEAAKWYRKAAEQGHAKAVADLKHLAELGNANAQNLLAQWYYSGHGTKRDLAETVKWYGKAGAQENVKSVSKRLKQLAEQGNANAQNQLAECYYYGWGVSMDKAEAVKWYRKAAEQGLAKAQTMLGICYYDGVGTAKDPAEAVKWFRKAVEQGDVKGLNGLGACYYDGIGVAKDYNEAVKWFRKAAEQGLAKAQYNLGRCYANGCGVAKDPAEADKWFRKAFLGYSKAARQGDANAQINLAFCYQNGKGVTKDHAEAIRWFIEAAEQGLATAQNNLGVCYTNGQDVTKDYNEAVKWYRKAAEQGLAKAQNNLGNCYANGWGVTKDYNEAVKWYRKAAEQGHAKAQSNLGSCYVRGWGVAKNPAEADKWFRKVFLGYSKAARQGDANAQVMLGGCYINGQGVTKDYNEAVKWLRKAAEQGHAKAQSMLGACYYDGIGVTKDYNEAVKWFRKAAEQGDANAQSTLGACYYTGQGVTKDYKEVVKWVRKAAEQGLAKAQFNLFACYHNGLGVTKDPAEAVKWLRKAAEQGHAVAQYNLGLCYANGQGVTKELAEAVKWFRKAAAQGNYEAQKELRKLAMPK